MTLTLTALPITLGRPGTATTISGTVTCPKG